MVSFNLVLSMVIRILTILLASVFLRRDVPDLPGLL